MQSFDPIYTRLVSLARNFTQTVESSGGTYLYLSVHYKEVGTGFINIASFLLLLLITETLCVCIAIKLEVIRSTDLLS